MLRHAFRRLLWSLPTLVGVSILSFWFLSYVPDPTDDPAVVATMPRADLVRLRREKFLDLPRFVNVTPRDVRTRVDRAVEAIADGGADEGSAREELARLGGAGLPHLVPTLDALSPDKRASVALAMAPVAARMHLTGAADAADPARAAAFWTRFWEDRSIEFRRAAAHSDVSRLLRYRGPESADDVRQLDTFALAELFAALEPPDDAASLDRARTLVALIADVTGEEDRVSPGADLAEARACVDRWRGFWNVYRSDFVELGGPSRVAAMLTDTRYGKWALGAIAYRFGTSSSGAPVLDELTARAPITIAIVFGAIFLAYALAIPLGSFSAARRGQRTDLAIACVALGLYAIPTAVLAVAVSGSSGAPVTGVLAGIALLSLGLLAAPTRQLRSSLASTLTQDWIRAAEARGASKLRAILVHGLPYALLPVVTLAALEAPMVLGGAFVVERVFGLHGVGELTIRAVQVRDTGWLMVLSIVAAGFAAFFVVLTDFVYVLLDRRLAAGVLGRQGRA